MSKISCDVIQDLLPLYCDDVCSSDSQKIVEEHLQDCEVCTNMLHQLKSECIVSERERTENKEESAVLEKMMHSWKISLLKSFLKGIAITIVVLSIMFGAYYFLFDYQGSMVQPNQTSVSAYMETETHIVIKMQLFDGYCGGTIKAYDDGNGNVYVSIQRTIIKEKLPEGETEVAAYGLDLSVKSCTAVYYGRPNNCKLLWKKGDTLPSAPADIFD